MHYPDKRARYSNAAPWDFIPGTAHADNKTKIEAKTLSMARVADTYEQNAKGEHILVAGNKSARDNFRVTTARTQVDSAVPTQVDPTILQNGNNLVAESNAVKAKDADSSLVI